MDTYEKKYKEALEWARKVMQGKVGFVLDEVLEKFPELKESEDAKIRKVISDILLIDSDEIREILDANNVLMQNIDAWLEKQAEKKPVDKIDSSKIKKDPNPYWTLAPEYQLANKQKIADKVEPKFHKGDWITNGVDFTFQVRSIEDDMYLRSDDYFIDIETADKTFRLWTIKDAKDGDMLDDGSCTFILKELNTTPVASDVYCYLCTNGEFVKNATTLSFCIESTHPATKEQRDLLFQKMHEAGYEWDAEKKELRKIEQDYAWSEEDEKMLDEMYEFFDKHKIPSLKHNMDDYVKFIKSIKERVKPHNRWKPSDEQMNTLEYYMHTLICNKHKEILFGLYADLKKLREE